MSPDAEMGSKVACRHAVRQIIAVNDKGSPFGEYVAKGLSSESERISDAVGSSTLHRTGQKMHEFHPDINRPQDVELLCSPYSRNTDSGENTYPDTFSNQTSLSFKHV